MTAAASAPHSTPHRLESFHHHLPTFPQALASLLRTVVIALFVLTFVLQPILIPSESMERTLLVGDFLLFSSRQVYAPRWPPHSMAPSLYRQVARGDIIVLPASAAPAPSFVKRVVGLPGDPGFALPTAKFTREWRRPRRTLCVPSSPRLRMLFATTFLPKSTPTPKSIPIGGARCRFSLATANWLFPSMITLSSATIAITVRIPASGDLCRARPSSPAHSSSTSR